MNPCAASFVVALLVLRSVREVSNCLVCMSNMKVIATSSKIYGNSYPGEGGRPMDWLIKWGGISGEQTIFPSSGLTESNYVLIRFKPGLPLDDDAVVMYEPKSNHGGEGGNFVFADGHAAFARGKAYDELVSAARARNPD